MSRRDCLLGGLVVFLFGVLVGVVWQANVAWANGQGMAVGQLFGGMMGRDGSVAVLRGDALESGQVMVFLDYEGGGSNYSELLAQVPGPVEGGMLMGCGKHVWVIVQAKGVIYRWGVEVGEAWVCGEVWEVFVPVMPAGDD